MTAASLKPKSVVHLATINTVPRRAVSSGSLSDLKSDHLVNARLLAARRANPLGRYSAFPQRWQMFLHKFFLDAGEVAGFFKVSEKAAQKWWNGIGGPNGAKLDFAVQELPGAREYLYGRG